MAAWLLQLKYSPWCGCSHCWPWGNSNGKNHVKFTQFITPELVAPDLFHRYNWALNLFCLGKKYSRHAREYNFQPERIWLHLLPNLEADEIKHPSPYKVGMCKAKHPLFFHCYSFWEYFYFCRFYVPVFVVIQYKSPILTLEIFQKFETLEKECEILHCQLRPPFFQGSQSKYTGSCLNNLLAFWEACCKCKYLLTIMQINNNHHHHQQQDKNNKDFFNSVKEKCQKKKWLKT